MKHYIVGVASVLGLVIGMSAANAIAQTGADTVDGYVAAARSAAGQDHTFLFNRICTPAQPVAAPQAGAPPSPDPPARSLWHAEPVRVFDNLYCVGEIEYSAWAVTTSDGIIILDAIFDYSVEDEVVNGLTKLGLDPTTIKYVIVSHGHSDHAGGARHLQERFGARVVMSANDWDLVDRSGGTWPKPKRDIVATDGQRLTLGDTTLTLYLTPGHTLGTISTLIPVKDGTRTHLAAAWGGTAFNWMTSRAAYITPQTPDAFWFEAYGRSARRFRDIVAERGADVLISNHTNYDGSKVKLPALARRSPGDPHPYVIGNASVQRFLTVAEECAKAGLLRLN
jgi:metallo-beta-lactamase class B